MKLPSKLIIFVTLFFLSFHATAGDEDLADISTRTEKYLLHYVVNDDLTHSEHYQWALKVVLPHS